MGEEEGESQTESSKERKESVEVTETSKKIVRVITVTTYLFSVSMAAIMLSLYYLFFWNPTVQPGPDRLVDPIQLHFSRLYFNISQKAVGWREKIHGPDWYKPEPKNKGITWSKRDWKGFLTLAQPFRKQHLTFCI